MLKPWKLLGELRAECDALRIRLAVAEEQLSLKTCPRCGVNFYKGSLGPHTRAHGAVYQAIKKGSLVRPDACEKCGKASSVVAHHEDYAKPLAVVWLCHVCHATTRRKPVPVQEAH